MPILNTHRHYGAVAILVHWVMVLTVIGLFALGWYMVELSYYDALYKTLPFVHKSVGILLAVLLIFWWLWKRANSSPAPVPGCSKLERLAARIVHLGLYYLIGLILVSGYLIATADGSSIGVFDWFEVPAALTGIPRQEDIAGWVHEYLAYTVIGLAVAHAAAACKHHFINRDDTLRRMLGMSLSTTKAEKRR